MLVTGGAGFIGSHVVDALVARGDSVVVLDDLSTGSRDNVNRGAELLVADVADIRAYGRMGRVDAIAHFASKTKVVESIEKPEVYRRIIIGGTAQAADFARACGARLVNVSSGGAGYGETPVCAKESDPLVPEAPYGRFKIEAEALLAGANAMTLRLANVYGPRQRGDLEGGVVSIFSERWSREPLTVFGDGTAERDYVHVADVVGATLAGIGGVHTGAYNVGTGVATSVNALIAAMTDLLGPPVGVHRAPPRAGELQRSCLDPGKAARDGFWRPSLALAEGLRKMSAAA